MNCLICQTEMTGPNRGYWFACPQCGFLASSLTPSIGGEECHGALDEVRRRAALDDLRHASFERVLDTLQALRTSHPTRLLDVGCAHGWFLQTASRRGYLATGLEPDPHPSQIRRDRTGCR